MCIESKLKTFLINLDSSEERCQSAQSQLIAANIPFERVSAFDGRRADPRSFPEYDEARALAWFGRKLSGSEIGCYFSHIDCARRFLETDAPYGLALEDDLLLKERARHTLSSLLEYLEDGNEPGFHMINLGQPVKRFGTLIRQNSTGPCTRDLYRAHYFPDTTTAILWSREGAERFLETAHSIYMPIDHFLRLWNCQTDAGYGFTDPPITTTGAESDIERAKVGQDVRRARFYHLRKHRRLWLNKLRAKSNRRLFKAGLAHP